jgi:riboflavin kinase/FMN adenylyltransferase
MPLILPPPRLPAAFPVLGPGAAVPTALARPAVAIGNFDGVHLGHRHVIAAAKQTGRPVVVLTFEPHPRRYFQPDVPLFRLTDAAGKARLLAAAGADGLAALPFDAAMAATSPEDFVDRLLVDWLGAAAVLVGRDFHYGSRRAGNAATLKDAGKARGFAVTEVAALDGPEGPISSSVIREALASGRVETANALLGHAWFVTGPVIHGEKRGRELGYPTANVRLDAACRLAHGIYAVMIGIDGVWHQGVASYGRRPQFDNGAPLLEVHVFDFSGNLYDKEVDVAFASYLRGEAKFPSLEALVAQMDADSREARARLAI